MADLPVTKIRVKIPSYLTDNQRAEVAQRIMEHITARSRAGLNPENKKWSGDAGKYTKQYAKKKGVSPSGPVDLTLSSEMLDKMQYFKGMSTQDSLVIGYRKGSQVERKAEGNIIGSYGGKPKPRKARPFLQMMQSDVDKIVSLVAGEPEIDISTTGDSSQLTVEF